MQYILIHVVSSFSLSARRQNTAPASVTSVYWTHFQKWVGVTEQKYYRKREKKNLEILFSS